MEITPKRESSRHRLIAFLFAAVNFLANDLTDSCIVDIPIEGYTLIASNDDIVTSSIFTYSSSSLSFRLDDWVMETRE